MHAEIQRLVAHAIPLSDGCDGDSDSGGGGGDGKGEAAEIQASHYSCTTSGIAGIFHGGSTDTPTSEIGDTCTELEGMQEASTYVSHTSPKPSSVEGKGQRTSASPQTIELIELPSSQVHSHGDC